MIPWRYQDPGRGTAARPLSHWHLDVIFFIRHDACMRITLTLDDDIADSLRDQARLLNKPFKQVVNEVLRRGLSPSVQEERPVFRVKPLPGGFRPAVDPFKLKHLSDQIQATDFADPDTAGDFLLGKRGRKATRTVQ